MSIDNQASSINNASDLSSQSNPSNPSSDSQPHKLKTTIAIIGSGFGGIGMAIKLKQAGINDFVILEKADSTGGTWRDNRYPGAACDVQSHLYSFSFAPKHDWTRKFAEQPEIERYIQECVERFDLSDHLYFNHEVTTADYDSDKHLWHIACTNGATATASITIAAVGQLNQPAYPSIAGMADFEGEVMHSARWNHDLDLSGKQVAVIGTGASAIQFVPKIVPLVSKLTLFQRSAAWVLPKADREFSSLENAIFKRLPWYDRLYRHYIYWRNESRAIGFTKLSSALKGIELLCKWNLRKAIKNPQKRKALTPDYPAGCKRILISNDYYPALAEDNVDIVTHNIDKIVPNGVVTHDGQQHPADIIIYGTGFKATEFLTPMTITGLNGLSLNTAWKNGAEAYKGTTVHGFPNLFLLFGPNTSLAHSSIIYMLEAQYSYVMSAIQKLQRSRAKALMPKASVQAEHNDELQAQLKNTVWHAGCTSWYKTADGKITNNWPDFTFNFRKQTKTLDADNYEWLHP